MRRPWGLIMGEHYPRGTTEASSWCPRCKRETLHRVDHPVPPAKGGGRLGPCIDPAHPPLGLSKKQESAKKKRETEERNPRLF